MIQDESYSLLHQVSLDPIHYLKKLLWINICLSKSQQLFSSIYNSINLLNIISIPFEDQGRVLALAHYSRDSLMMRYSKNSNLDCDC
jgi:hypothetical protein